MCQGSSREAPPPVLLRVGAVGRLKIRIRIIKGVTNKRKHDVIILVADDVSQFTPPHALGCSMYTFLPTSELYLLLGKTRASPSTAGSPGCPAPAAAQGENRL